MSKELFIEAHMELVEKLMEENPQLTWDEAYQLTADDAYDWMREKLFDAADQMRKRDREGRKS